MDKNLFNLIVVAAVAVLLGLIIVKKQTESPVLRELLNQQMMILKAQNRLETKMASPQSGNAVGSDQSMTAFLFKQQLLEQRLATLETQIKNLQNVPAQPQNAPNNFQGPPQEDYSKVYNIALGDTPIIGKKDAPVTIQEFVDFQCPFCARFHPPVLEVLKAYPNQVRYVIKNFPLPFHPMAKPAAKAALAANEQGKYAEMADAILADNSNLSEDKFKELAKKIGLNVDKFTKDLKDKDAQYEALFNKDIDLARQVDVMGTPTFFINGRKTMARDFQSYKKEIDDILNGVKK